MSDLMTVTLQLVLTPEQFERIVALLPPTVTRIEQPATHNILESSPRKAGPMTQNTKKPYLITTQHRGVFAGLVDPDTITQPTLAVDEARMAIYWGTTKGVMQLAETGPTDKSRISAPADIPALHNVTAVFTLTDEAWAAWQRS